jgi:hypothetical protein
MSVPALACYPSYFSRQAIVCGELSPMAAFKTRSFDNHQRFDFAGVQGRLLSSSYAPEAGHPNHAPMLAELASIFNAYQQDGEIVFEYDTRVYYGQLTIES